MITTSSDVALRSQFVPYEDQTSAWSDDSGNTQALLGFDSITGGPVTVSTTASGVQKVNHVSQLLDTEWNAAATFVDLPSGGSTLIAPDANSSTASTPTAGSSGYPGVFDYLDPVNSQLLDIERNAVASFGDLPSGGGTLTTPDSNCPTASTPSFSSYYSGGLDYLDPVGSQCLNISQRH